MIVSIIENTELLYCEAMGSYTIQRFSNGQSIKISKRLCIIEQSLSPDIFFRSHNSYLVNIKQVTSIRFSKNQMFLILKNKQEIPVSLRKKAEFCKFLRENNIIILKGCKKK